MRKLASRGSHIVDLKRWSHDAAIDLNALDAGIEIYDEIFTCLALCSGTGVDVAGLAQVEEAGFTRIEDAQQTEFMIDAPENGSSVGQDREQEWRRSQGYATPFSGWRISGPCFMS